MKKKENSEAMLILMELLDMDGEYRATQWLYN